MMHKFALVSASAVTTASQLIIMFVDETMTSMVGMVSCGPVIAAHHPMLTFAAAMFTDKCGWLTLAMFTLAAAAAAAILQKLRS